MNPPLAPATVLVTYMPDPQRRRRLWDLIAGVTGDEPETPNPTPPALQARQEQAEPDTAA
ncbi:hypothetical protein GCM10010914_06480 [Deinococcus wulumuqiensis]|uniref:Uncharacterized protein n=1 Tax=Deinococcus wulumuqiensis TaxID=980427 RepID=A0AAV4K1C9_9DEIO|nr:hypothetical protein GCM10010914_06480 [Deinococcus wulumuqiensis]GGP28664.1 hypothetical protein GCM10008021_03150 [Deinococcus wulumuqiensis]